LEESEINDDDGEDVDDNDDEDGMDVDDTEEEVEILVSFEENGQEYHLVRLLDPVLLVGKVSHVPLNQRYVENLVCNLMHF
jgi:hypothetical protein